MLPLAGVRIIAVEQYGAGPFGSMLLGDLGAEVIKIENPAEGGDVGRAVGPHFFGPGDSQFFQAFNRNKRSLTLDLKHPEARGVFHDLVRSADATLDNLRGDQPEKLGLTYEALKEVNPRIVCAHLSAYGREGSRKAWPGYDYLMQAEAGIWRSPASRTARRAAWPVDRRPDDRALRGLCAGLRRGVGARRPARARHRRVAVRRRAAEPHLPRRSGTLTPASTRAARRARAILR